MDDSKFLITGANGQLGLALQALYPNALATDSKQLDITNWDTVKGFDWGNVTTILNAAAFTDVDGAETAEGRVNAWKVNAQGAANLVRIAAQKDLLLVHISTDYVFDGTKTPHAEDEPLSPLNVYGASKAAGDVAVANHQKHYILRTSWVIGEGKNFVRTMLELGKKGVNPRVVSDQAGRPAFTDDLARAIDTMLKVAPAFGVYNVTNSGDPVSWAGLARAIFQHAGLNNTVTDIATEAYFKDKPGAAPRPLNSVFDLSKIELTGFKPKNWHEALDEYVNKEVQ